MGLMRHHKTEGGQGGKRGHSNMCHWVTAEEIKDAASHLRRKEAKQIIAGWHTEMKKSEALDETEYLLRSPANARALAKSIRQSNQGKVIVKTFAELGIK